MRALLRDLRVFANDALLRRCAARYMGVNGYAINRSNVSANYGGHGFMYRNEYCDSFAIAPVVLYLGRDLNEGCRDVDTNDDGYLNRYGSGVIMEFFARVRHDVGLFLDVLIFRMGRFYGFCVQRDVDSNFRLRSGILREYCDAFNEDSTSELMDLNGEDAYCVMYGFNVDVPIAFYVYCDLDFSCREVAANFLGLCEQDSNALITFCGRNNDRTLAARRQLRMGLNVFYRDGIYTRFCHGLILNYSDLRFNSNFQDGGDYGNFAKCGFDFFRDSSRLQDGNFLRLDFNRTRMVRRLLMANL